jgi:hypothetical protein
MSRALNLRRVKRRDKIRKKQRATRAYRIAMERQRLRNEIGWMAVEDLARMFNREPS